MAASKINMPSRIPEDYRFPWEFERVETPLIRNRSVSGRPE